MAEQVPGLDKKVQALQEDNDRLKQDLRQVRENLARRIAALPLAPPRSAARLSSPKSVTLHSGEPALAADGPPIAGPPIAGPPIAGPPIAGSAMGPATAAKPEPASNAAGTHYRVQRGDTLSVVAARVYHNPRKWKLIYDANQDTLGGSQKLKTGQVLIIPK
jgi:LysM repeat protein